MNRLRSLAVTVDEPDPPSYDAALSAGVEVLRDRCVDLGAGPRSEGSHDDEPNNSGWTPL